MCKPCLVDLSIACAVGACLGKGVGWVEGLLTKYQINTHHDISQNSEVGSHLSGGWGESVGRNTKSTEPELADSS